MRNTIALIMVLISGHWLPVRAQAELPPNDRMLRQAASGITMGALAAVTAGTILSFGIYELSGGNNDGSWEDLGRAVGSYMLGYTTTYLVAGSYVMVQVGNKGNEVQGRWIPTLIGKTAGLAAGAGLAAIASDNGMRNPVLVVGTVLVTSAAGGLAGYNASRIRMAVEPSPDRMLTLRISL